MQPRASLKPGRLSRQTRDFSSVFTVSTLARSLQLLPFNIDAKTRAGGERSKSPLASLTKDEE
jgi:hypothetical protein